VTASFCVVTSGDFALGVVDAEGEADGLGASVGVALGDGSALAASPFAVPESGDEDGDGAGVPGVWDEEPDVLVPSSAIAAGR
jgi:hypothetical protein